MMFRRITIAAVFPIRSFQGSERLPEEAVQLWENLKAQFMKCANSRNGFFRPAIVCAVESVKITSVSMEAVSADAHSSMYFK